MNYNTVYVGMDVHKESFTLYHQLTSQHVECIILAPTTMLEQRSKKRIKTDKRDAEIIAKCLAQHNYSPVHIPTATDEQIKEFLRMRDDHKLALKKIKQQILASYLGLVPGENTSSDDRHLLGITKAGDRHVRLLLTEAAQSYTRGQIGNKSKDLKSRQSGNSAQVIGYADKANERLRRRYYKMVLGQSKKHNVAKVAVARELACFMWGMMTEHISADGTAS